MNKPESDVRLDADWEAHCVKNGLTDEERKKQKMGFRAGFVSRNWEAASDDIKEKVRKIIVDERRDKEKLEVTKYNWMDRDQVDEAELQRRHRAMQFVE
jgi:hypothetical protein